MTVKIGEATNREYGPIFDENESLNSVLAKFNKQELGNHLLDESEITSENNIECSLNSISFEGTRWRGCRFNHATFVRNNLKNARFDDCEINASFNVCDLENAIFRNSNPEQSVAFLQCNLSGADLRGAPGCYLDDCYIGGARLPKDISDPWSILRRRYTGIRAIANLMLLVAFFLPYVIETILWVSLNRIENLPPIKESMCAQGCSEMPVAALLFGYHNGWISVLTALLLVTYNIMRGYLTIQVAPLRENEERCHYTPARADFSPLYSMHRFVSTVMWFAIASFAVHLFVWLTSMVNVPKWFVGA